MDDAPVFTANRSRPSGVIATQHGAVWPLANGEPAMAVRDESGPIVYTETLPAFGPSCAFETNSCHGFVGRTALPNGPMRWAGSGEPGAVASRPSKPTRKLSRYDGPFEGPTRVPMSVNPAPSWSATKPSALPPNRTWPGRASSGRLNVEPGI